MNCPRLQAIGLVRYSVLCCFALVWSSFSQAANRTYIPVGEAKTRRSVVALAPIKLKTQDRRKIAKTLKNTLVRDLNYMDLFKLLPEDAFLENTAKVGVTPDSFKMSDWTSIGAELLVKAALSIEGNQFILEGHLYDTFRSKQLFAKRYVAELKDAATAAHTFANNIVEAVTGDPGIFLTRIAMVCNRTKKKEIYSMNIFGSEVKQITHHRSISFAPAWNPDSTRLAYSVYTRHKGNIKNIDLYEFDFKTNTIRLLSNRKGINSGASYSPNGRDIALTMSFLGNPEVFALDPDKKKVTRLTKSFGFDVDPAWSPDGSKIAFVSSRPGRPMVYVMNADGSGAKRLTYAGRYNSAPSWSPRGDKLAFAGWKGGKFDIFIMNSNGTKIERLTKKQGTNEDPSFSPDGNFIAFTSNRTGRKNIYVMNTNGTFVKRLTYGLGDCEAPKWSGVAKK